MRRRGQSVVLLLGLFAASCSLPINTTVPHSTTLDVNGDNHNDHDKPRGDAQPPAIPGKLNQPLAQPGVLKDYDPRPHVVRVKIEASESQVQLLPNGPTTTMMLYNGQYPGPLLDVQEGDDVTVEFKNSLPSGEHASLHFHGLKIPPTEDGNPLEAINPGDPPRFYRWKVLKGAAGTYFYHDHGHGHTAEHVIAGMFGPIRIRPREDPLPAEDFGDTLLALIDNKFDATNQILPDSDFDNDHGREGDTLFVNGQLNPVMSMRPGEMRRLRIVNASSARYYLLQVAKLTGNGPGTLDFNQVGSDGGLFESPVTRSQILMASAERAEVVLKAPMTPGTYVLQNLPYERVLDGNALTPPLPLATLLPDNSGTLMTIKIAGKPVKDAKDIPRKLRRIDPLGYAIRTREFTLAEVAPGLITDRPVPDFAVSGIGLDGAGPDDLSSPPDLFPMAPTSTNVNRFNVNLGDTELWRVSNFDEVDHPMHIHGYQFQLQDGSPLPTAWKDIMNVPHSNNPGVEATVRSFKVRFGPYTGLQFFHCHNLQHEGAGMMLGFTIQ